MIFPNTVPPFFPSFVLFAGPPEPEHYEHRLAGIRAHNRWLLDWCNEFPERRAGIGQIFLNDIDDAIDDVRWIKENGLRGGILLPNIPPSATWMKPIYDPEYDRLWEVCQDLEVPVHVHGGTGAPDYGPYPVSMLLYITEVGLLQPAPVRAHAALGRVRALPAAEVRDDRDGLRVGAARCSPASTPRSGASATPAPPARSGTARTTCCHATRPSTSTRTAGWA